jgi:predicted RNA binding protein YcfA (HicA-like mRNA interferase family)
MANKNPRIPKEILDEATANGWSYTRANGDHLKWTHPKVQRVVFSSSTPSDHRTWTNHILKLRRELRFATGTMT